mmetsp:Transcript_29251/g.70568  ORF Transcript_29251/g.70568 Transcript_29251/m.70568 type:complete len:372 (-) Transcript_29251:1305-2420(-)
MTPLDQAELDAFFDLGLAEHGEADGVASVHVLIAVCRTAVDDLHLFEVDEDAPRHGIVPLVVIFGGGEYCEDPRSLGHGDSLRMGLVRAHNVRESLLLQKVRHGLVPEADGPPAAKAVAVSRPPVHAVIFLILRRGVGPDAIRRHLLIIVVLVLVGGVDARDLRHVEDVLYPAPLHLRVGDRAGDAPVDAEDVLIYHGRQGHSIEGGIGHLPHPVSQVVPEALPALVDERPGAVVLLPAVDVARLVIPPQQEHLLGEHELHREEVRHHLQAGHAPIDVIPQEHEVPGGEAHSEVPHVVAEEMQVLEVAVYVPEDVRGTLEEDASGLVLEDGTYPLVELDEILRELFGLEVRYVFVGGAEHVLDAVDEGLLG